MLTYRPNRDGSLHAAYLGTVRIGYVERRAYDRWLWQLSLLSPEGGYPRGIVDNEEDASAQLAPHLDRWLNCAKLRRVT